MEAAAGKRNLQVAISSLRRLLDDHSRGGSALVRRDGPAYVLALPDVGCADVAVFAAARDEARRRSRHGDEALVLDAGDRALVAYGGDLLPEQGPADWAVGLRRQLAADAAELALLVGETALGVGSHDVAAAACARDWTSTATTTGCGGCWSTPRRPAATWRPRPAARSATTTCCGSWASTPRCAGTPWPRPQIRPWRSA